MLKHNWDASELPALAVGHTFSHGLCLRSLKVYSGVAQGGQRMRVIRSVHGRSRFGRASRVVKNRRIQYGGGYEEFGGIISESTVSDKDSSPVRHDYQVTAPGTPRNAFDVVSEYLTHPSICEESSVKFSDNDVDCSLFYSKSATQLMSRSENKQPATNIVRTCRRINGRINVHGQAARPSCSPQTTSFGEIKSPQPLTEVNTNVSTLDSMRYQENDRKPAECASDDSRKACSQSGESNDLTSLSHMVGVYFLYHVIVSFINIFGSVVLTFHDPLPILGTWF